MAGDELIRALGPGSQGLLLGKVYSVSTWESLCVYELGNELFFFFFIYVLKVVVKYI